MKISKYDGDPLILRSSVAEAKLEDGRTVEVSLALGNGALIGMLRGTDGEHVATYAVSPNDFIEAMLNCEEGKEEFELVESRTPAKGD